MHTDDGEHPEWFDVTEGLRQDVFSAYFQCIFAAAIHPALVRFSEDPDILRGLVHLEEDRGENGVEVEPLACVRRSIWGILFVDDAGIVSKSAEGLVKMMTVIAAVFEAVSLTVSGKKTETILLRTPNQALRTSPLVIETAGKR